MPTKLPSDIPKFEGNPRKDPTNHVHSFHMWCSSNSIIEDSIYLCLFQHTLTGVDFQWYVDQPRATYSTLETLATTFLSYFQLSFDYDISIELLISFRQNSATHLSDHGRE